MTTHATPARRGGVLLIVLAASMWGTTGVATKALYQISATTPLSVGLFRLAIAAPLLLIACLLALRSQAWRLTRRDAGLIALIGAALAISQASYFSAIAYSGVAIATLITICTAPVLVALIAAAISSEPIERRTLVALAAALVGIALLVGGPQGGALPADAGQLLVGTLLSLAAALSYAVVVTASRRASRSIHPLQLNAGAFTCGALLLLLANQPAGPQLSYPAEGWLLLAYLGAVPTALAYVLFQRGMRSTPATVASVLTLAEPLMATLLAWALFGEQLGPLGGVGLALLIGALVILARE